MRTTTHDLTDAQPGDAVETNRGPARVLTTGSKDNVIAELKRLIKEQDG